MTIAEKQQKIVDNFSLLEGDAETLLTYLTELGRRLPPIKESDKTDDRLIQGCQSKVWLIAQPQGSVIKFSGDSNTIITKGLLSLLVDIFSGQPTQEIINAELFFIERMGLGRFIGSQRSNGLQAMIRKFKQYALQQTLML